MKNSVETLKTDAFEMKWFRFGAGKQAMVILPGLSIKSVMESAEFIASAYSMFAKKYTVYVFDRRSDIPPVYGICDMAHDTEKAFDELGIKDAYIFGVSLGGMIAQVIAAERPDLVKKAVFGSTAARLSSDSAEKLAQWIDLAEKNDTASLVFEFSSAVYSDELMRKNEGAFEYLAKMITDEELVQFITVAKSVRNFDISDELHNITCPVLVLGAGKDKLISREMTEELAEKTNAELYIYEDYTHSAYDEAPDYKDRIFKFFNKK